LEIATLIYVIFCMNPNVVLAKKRYSEAARKTMSRDLCVRMRHPECGVPFWEALGN
jgi:hypothetical protein